jgi:hypothetical protein
MEVSMARKEVGDQHLDASQMASRNGIVKDGASITPTWRAVLERISEAVGMAYAEKHAPCERDVLNRETHLTLPQEQSVLS